jgi:nucleoside-diphosphate-sugar epimerase
MRSTGDSPGSDRAEITVPPDTLPEVRTVVTGGAGFIGSTLTEALLADGHEVTVVDCFTDYYDPADKRANLASVADHPRLRLLELDLTTADLAPVVDGAEVIWHLAGQPGVRLSWSDGFAAYELRNVLATQRLLEASKTAGTPRIVYASSSSVYGNAERYPTLETDRPEPYSPYGVTKLAAEHLCVLYAANWGVPTVSLRYFTVYGPRQRPDMATHRLIEAALDQHPFPLLGDGAPERGFTFGDDVVDATVRAGTTPGVAPGTVLNVSGPFSCTLRDLIELVGEEVGAPVPLEHRPAEAGDATKTGGSTERIEATLGWRATTSLREGVAAQVAWHRARRA